MSGPHTTAREIRAAFLGYFEWRGHTVVPSASLIPAGDPTLLFTNAGMNQFKETFTGQEKRPYSRATTSQRCVRAGGKHNDLEAVGRTARHHTFFEMLGNFSFGDYFKKEAMEFAWELLTKEYGLDSERLAFTVFGGADGIPADDFARAQWPKVTGLPASRVHALGLEDNFWAMGETGPCGPCSEIHFHLGEDLPCAEEAAGRACKGVACDCDRWLEVWNLVFMEFERKEGKLIPLPKPSIDTGMGLERLSAILQGKRSNFETDLLRPLIAEAEKRLGKSYGRNADDDMALRVLADHARASAYLIADGLVPSNEGRGYVLRRILRRGVYHAHILGSEEPTLTHLIPRVFEILGEAHPVSEERRRIVADAVRREEETFLATIERGLVLLVEELKNPANIKVTNNGVRVLSGTVVFQLQDTHGLPPDLTALICRRKGIEDFDWAEYNAEMEKQRERSKASSSFGVKINVTTNTPDLPPTEFHGYENLFMEAKILAVLPDCTLVLDKTSFYPEGGGQVADRGEITEPEGGFRFQVDDVARGAGGIVFHQGKLVGDGAPSEGDQVRLAVNKDIRRPTERHHTATHLLHAALRKVLGTHVGQAGSYVGPDRLRFDFTHHAPVSAAELGRIQEAVNRTLVRNVAVAAEEHPIEEARKMGAMAFFGEKYGSIVRVVEILPPNDEGDLLLSREFCGGTHVRATGEIGFVRVLSESAVASGIRRIEAVAGDAATESILADIGSLERISRRLSVAPREAEVRLEKLLDETAALAKEIARAKAERAMDRVSELLAKREEVGGVSFVAARIDADEESLRKVSFEIAKRLGSGLALLAAESEGKARLVLQVSKDLAARLPARELILPLAAKIGGKGGGKPEMAMAGGPRAEGIDEALAALPQVLRERLDRVS